MISNIGVFKDDDETRDTNIGTTPRFTVSRVYFTNGALTLALSWQEGVVSGELMRGLAEDLQKYMVCFDKTGFLLLMSWRRQLGPSCLALIS